jgi:hypothetical protein
VLTPAGLVIALIISAPALWDASNGSLGMGAALVRLLAAFILVAIGTAVLRKIMAPSPPVARTPDDAVGADAHPARRRDDA